jgi:hypothetical protein
MAVKQFRYRDDPPSYAYTVTKTFEVYDANTAGVLDELLGRLQAAVLMAGGVAPRHEIGAMYGVDHDTDNGWRSTMHLLHYDCAALLQTVVAMLEVGHQPEGEHERKLLVRALRQHVPAIPAAPGLSAPDTATASEADA